jgi:hypothetical protein
MSPSSPASISSASLPSSISTTVRNSAILRDAIRAPVRREITSHPLGRNAGHGPNGRDALERVQMKAGFFERLAPRGRDRVSVFLDARDSFERMFLPQQKERRTSKIKQGADLIESEPSSR